MLTGWSPEPPVSEAQFVRRELGVAWQQVTESDLHSRVHAAAEPAEDAPVEVEDIERAAQQPLMGRPHGSRDVRPRRRAARRRIAKALPQRDAQEEHRRREDEERAASCGARSWRAKLPVAPLNVNHRRP